VRRSLPLALLFVLAWASLAVAADDKPPAAEDVADDALDVVSAGYPTPHDGYQVVICRAGRAAELANDTALGAFVRHMRAVKSDLAAVVTPVGYSDQPTYVVYFAGRTPLGIAAFAAGDPRPTDAAVAKAYVAVSGPVTKRKRRALYKAAAVAVEDGSVEALQIVGWK
jgi:hypothetical protein